MFRLPRALASVAVTAVAAAEGLVAYYGQDDQAKNSVKDFKAKATVVVLARDVSDFGDLPSRHAWRKLDPTPGVAAWTDDYSDVLRAILRKKLGS